MHERSIFQFLDRIFDLLANRNNWNKKCWTKKISWTYSHWIPATERGWKRSTAAVSRRMCWSCRLCFAIVCFVLFFDHFFQFFAKLFTDISSHLFHKFLQKLFSSFCIFVSEFTFLHFSFKLSSQFLLWTLMVVGNYAHILGLSRHFSSSFFKKTLERK